ncbi:chorismate mutase [Bacilli bacterium PM5-3]|nr:chorismate mutase [Bacilli bacterium PM5-3]MDH6603855.1 chorismate mutase [Bacilli bacterium PM5-9]
MKNLNDYRQEIDEIDDEIIALLTQRFEKSLEIGSYKKEKSLKIIDNKREEEIKDKILKCKNSELIKEKILGVYFEIFSASKELQK